jgi:hypothetical protein
MSVAILSPPGSAVLFLSGYELNVQYFLHWLGRSAIYAGPNPSLDLNQL